jgi:hypothetical protein
VSAEAVVTVRAFADKMVAAAVAGSPYAPPSNDALLAAVQSLQASVNDRFVALQTNVTALQTTVQSLQGTVAALQTTVSERFLALDLQVLNLNARAANNGASEGSDAIVPLRNSAGYLPPAVMPATLSGLCRLTGNGVDPLLAFYGLAMAGNVADRKQRLARHLGVRTVQDLFKAI